MEENRILPQSKYGITELNAINYLLSTIGESPINTLTGAITSDVTIGLNHLTNATREILLQGWHFNIEEDYPLVPNADKHIVFPSSILRVTSPTPEKRYVKRGDRLYDLENHTYEFDAPVTMAVTLAIPFVELPETFKWYVVQKAARTFQQAVVGDPNSDAFLAEKETWAKIEAVREDSRMAHRNMGDNEVPTLLNGWTVGTTLRR